MGEEKEIRLLRLQFAELEKKIKKERRKEQINGLYQAEKRVMEIVLMLERERQRQQEEFKREARRAAKEQEARQRQRQREEFEREARQAAKEQEARQRQRQQEEFERGKTSGKRARSTATPTS